MTILGQPVEIVDKARSEKRVILTHDHDFSQLIALSGAQLPSVITFRLANMRSESVNHYPSETQIGISKVEKPIKIPSPAQCCGIRGGWSHRTLFRFALKGINGAFYRRANCCHSQEKGGETATCWWTFWFDCPELWPGCRELPQNGWARNVGVGFIRPEI